MFMVICDVVSCLLVSVWPSSAIGGLGQGLVSSPGIAGFRCGEKNWFALQFFFPNRKRSLPVDTAQKGPGCKSREGFARDGSEDLNRGDPAKPGRRRFKPQDGTLALE